jgi:photosystem II stability/assembly factor-like uncharacterized protein
MIEPTCQGVRIMLQEPCDGDLATLNTHIAGCASCRAYVTDTQRLDAAIVTAVRNPAPAGSIAHAVRGRIEAEVRQASLAPRRRSWIGLRAFAFAVPLAVLAVFMAVAMPQYATHLRETDTHAAPWTSKNYDAAYPMTIDAARPDHLLAGANGRVYESFDAGRAWHPLAPLPGSYAIRDLVIDRSDPSRYLVAAKHSVLVTNDAGRHWSIAVDGLTGAFNMFLTQDRVEPGTFYVGPSILWKSTNHGVTWVPAGPGQIFAPFGIQSLAQDGDTLYTGITGGGVAVSHDGGASWTRHAASFKRTVFDVVVGDSAVWAATQNGVFKSIDGGAHWRLSTPRDHFLVTSVLADHGLVLAGGIGALYRSTDGGKHWRLGMDGFPPGPYLYSLTADPSNPRRIYASLNSDGIFRSDNGGKTWSAATTGLPLHVVQTNGRRILFLRHGVLWYTSVNGGDPGNLTVQSDVRHAAVAPDNSGAVYVSGSDAGWRVDLVSVGSLAQTLIAGSGDMPKHLFWAPDSTRIAAVSRERVYVSTLSHRSHSWPLAHGDRVEGWTADHTALLVWDPESARLVPRLWRTGAPAGASIGPFAGAPHVAPDGATLAVLAHGSLAIGSTAVTPHAVASFGPECRLGPWSDDNARVLVRCGAAISLVGSDGSRITLTAPGRVQWLPGSHSALLVFHHGIMTEWTRLGSRTLVRSASPIS